VVFLKIWGEIPKVSGVYNKQKKLNGIENSSGAVSKKDAISISNQAKDFQTVMKALKNVPDIREDKVNELADKYKTDSYDVSGRDVADKIIKSIFDKKI